MTVFKHSYNNLSFDTILVITYFTLIVAIFSCTNSNALLERKFAKLESSYNGKIGIYAVNTANGFEIKYRANHRFPMSSTSKIMMVAGILKKSMFDTTLLNQKIFYTQENLRTSGYAPITKRHRSMGMTVNQLCAATISYSDNAAANLLMKNLGGPEAVTLFSRSIGDSVFRLDRWEPALNSAIPGDPRDTSTPEAMGKSLQKLTLGNALALEQRDLLKTWLKDNTTGDERIRAGIPSNWVVGDKTGTGEYGTTNDIAVIWPSVGKPIIMSIYFTQMKKKAAPNNEIIAKTASILIEALKCNDSYLQ